MVSRAAGLGGGTLPAVFVQLAIERCLSYAEHACGLEFIVLSHFKGVQDRLFFHLG